MVALLSAFTIRLQSQNPMMAMLSGMMPIARQQINKVDPSNIQALSAMLGEAFRRASDPTVSVEEYDAWIGQIQS